MPLRPGTVRGGRKGSCGTPQSWPDLGETLMTKDDAWKSPMPFQGEPEGMGLCLRRCLSVGSGREGVARRVYGGEPCVLYSVQASYTRSIS